jgi:hypothetical protein
VIKKPPHDPRGAAKKFKMETVLAGTLEKYVTLFGQDTPAPRCQAQSKRSKQQCRKASMTGKNVCRVHGGVSTGPRTEQGRKRCAAAKTIHGLETRELRKTRAQKFHEMKAWVKFLN